MPNVMYCEDYCLLCSVCTIINIWLFLPQLGICISMSHEKEPLGTGEISFPRGLKRSVWFSISVDAVDYGLTSSELWLKTWDKIENSSCVQRAPWHWPDTCWKQTASRSSSSIQMSSVIFPSKTCCSSTATMARREQLWWDRAFAVPVSAKDKIHFLVRIWLFHILIIINWCSTFEVCW